MSVCQLAPLSEAYLAVGFCAGIIPVAIERARSIASVGPTDFLALERQTSSVKVVEDLDGDGIPESSRSLVSLSGLNHGFVTTSQHLYASTGSTVYRWLYNPTTKTIVGPSTTVIVNMNDNGEGGTNGGNHVTRTLVWDDVASALYVSVGSIDNIDDDSFRARIRRFTITNTTTFPINFTTGEIFADGLRNEVAMEISPIDGMLWGAGNSADQLSRTDLGTDIYNDNPAEELHRFASAGQNYGYPYCWREYKLPAQTSKGRGTAWSWPDSSVSDAACRSNYAAPVLAMQAHSAPLGLTFYNYKDVRPPECDGVTPFPREMNGYVFLAFHGSWNRAIPTGYKVVYVPTTADGKGVKGGISANPVDLLAHEGNNAQWPDGFRPVDVSFDTCGRLLVSSDGSGNTGSKIVRIEKAESMVAPSQPTMAPKLQPVPAPTVDTPSATLLELLFTYLTSLFNLILSLFRN
jgi:glucose/arabinose dehydrogenase